MSELTKEVQNLGKHCSYRECNRLDFLPIKCDYCLLVFCRDHSGLTSHKCDKFDESSRASEKTNLKPFEFFKCSFSECSTENKEIVEVICDYCKLNYCMKHRLPFDHKCAVKLKLDDEVEKQALQKEEQKQSQKKEFKFEMKQNVSEKNSALANKLALMKLRQTAQGPPGLPEDSKFYCFIQFNSSLLANQTPTNIINKNPFYFNLKWPVGKCVEFIVDKMKLNKSNLLKMKLFINENQIDSSLILDKFMKDNSVNQGSILDLKLIE
jgi:predicted nucleic acid binding AN1-type Zn finger protein